MRMTFVLGYRLRSLRSLSRSVTTDGMEIGVLGSGTSHGVPVIGCDCQVCRSEDPRDARFRSSALVRGKLGERVLIDAGPEFRLQAIREGIDRLDAVFITHAHADHVHGLDDLRPLTRDRPLPVFGNRETVEELRERFAYIFRETQQGGGKPRIVLHKVGEAPMDVAGLRITPVPVKHGALDVLGWRIDEAGRSAAYVTDASEIPAAALASLRELDVLIIGALREQPHDTHLNFDQALSLIAELKPRRAWLTHLCHEKRHRAIEDYIRAHARHSIPAIPVEPAWDGLRITVAAP